MNIVETFNKIVAFFMVLFGLTGYIPTQTQTPVPETAQTVCDISIMSYNVYVNGTGAKSPENRTEGVVNTVKNEMPDVVGFQEVDHDWLLRLESALTEYSHVGRGRGKSETEGEYSPIFYKTDKYNLVNSGTFWFSDTPDESSLTWMGTFRRICTWAVLEDKETGFVFAVFNSHWDHISIVSRNKSAELLIEKANEYAPDMPVVIIGDFNCKANTVAYETLINGGFADSMYVAPETMDIGTYHGYTKSDTAGELPIDHILFNDDYGYAHSYKVITDKYNGIYPSDHFAILSELSLYK